MRLVDLHCDVLYSLWKNPKKSFYAPNDLAVNAHWMEAFHQMVQVMALYVPISIPHNQRLPIVLQMIYIFHRDILSKGNKKYKWLRYAEDWSNLAPNEKGFVLSLEGCEAISDDESVFWNLVDKGVQIFGLTWNYGNLLGDGIGETRKAGLSLQGKQFLRWCQRANAIVDVSHLNEKGFWDCMAVDVSVMASHSNAKQICPHPRNLTDEQIQALICKEGIVGLTFVPEFLSANPSLDDIVRHIEHICMLGGENHLAIGSDFEGIDKPLACLNNLGDIPHLLDYLSKFFSDELIQKICYKNFMHKILI